MKTFKEYINEGSREEYDAAAAYYAEMSRKELNMPKGAKKGDIIVFSKSKDWESDLEKLNRGSVLASVVVVNNPDKESFYKPSYGRVYSISSTDLKQYDFSKIVSLDDLSKVSSKIHNDISTFMKEENL